LRDYVESKGIILDTITPSSAIKSAFAAKIIENGDIWMKALDARNKMSHTYNLKTFEQTIDDIRAHYLAVFDALYMTMLEKEMEEGFHA
jgi:nucleotidyltransferase substrate binding protein (TIGR01987 family)